MGGQNVDEAAANLFRPLTAFERFAVSGRRGVYSADQPSPALSGRVNTAVSVRPDGYGAYYDLVPDPQAAAGQLTAVPIPRQRPPAPLVNPFRPIGGFGGPPAG